MPVSDKILVLGGYGRVGRVVAAQLAERYPRKVVAAGRRIEKAEALAYKTHGRVLPLALDLENPGDLSAALNDAKLVVTCVERPDDALARACLTRGLHYLDVSASYRGQQRVVALGNLARRQGAAAVVGSGLVPGLSNLLAAQLARRFTLLAQLDIYLLLGLGDVHGEDAVRWLLASTGHRFSVKTLGRFQSVQSLTDAQSATFPGDSRPRKTYRFDFADQHTLPLTTGAAGAATRLCFDSRVVTRLLVTLNRLGVKLRAVPPRALSTLVARLNLGSARFALVVEAKGRVNTSETRLKTALTGRNESRTTGVVTAGVADYLYRGRVAPGVHYIDEAVQLEELRPMLEQEGLRFWPDDPDDVVPSELGAI